MYKSLKKNIILDRNGNEILDFSTPTYNLNDRIEIIGLHEVSEDEEMRPDLISIKYFAIPNYVDVILKINGISNPFSITKGQILRIPNPKTISLYKNNLKTVDNSPRTQFTEPKRISKKDKRRLDFLKNKGNGKNKSSENLPPNMLKTNQRAKEFKGDKIILGTTLRQKSK